MISVAGGIVSDTQEPVQLRSLRAALFKEACRDEGVVPAARRDQGR